jgi:aryl-alcohol dehydrogenase-like predicted oxidoreductase
MRYREFPRTGWQIAEIGYGTWGMAGWSGSSDDESLESLDRAVALGCNFFDTAWAYGNGHSERLLARLLKAHRNRRLYIATKIPPRNRQWPARADYRLDEVFPPDHIREYTEKSLRNLEVDCIDLQQLHVWSDAWADDERWQRAVSDLKAQGLIRAFGISVNRWQPTNVLKALGTGLVDAVQVVYNIFDQAPEDELFPACIDMKVAVLARVPFDEGSLTDTLTRDRRWPEGDWRNIYFTPENLAATLARVEALRPLVPAGMDLPELALRFILGNFRTRPTEDFVERPAVTTTIPGMRKVRHVDRNLAASDGVPLAAAVIEQLRRHRWDRTTVIP